MITKKIHQIWLGENPLPPQFVTWSETWVAEHPGWEFKIWRDADAIECELYRKLAPACTSLAAKSNLLRLIILAHHGGIYVDTDTECFGNFEEMLTGVSFALCACSPDWHTPEHGWQLTTNNAFIYAAEGCFQMRGVMSVLNSSNFGIMDALLLCGPWLESVASKWGGVRYLPFTVANPNAPWEPGPDPLPDDCLAVHHWEGSWLADSHREMLQLPARKTPLCRPLETSIPS